MERTPRIQSKPCKLRNLDTASTRQYRDNQKIGSAVRPVDSSIGIMGSPGRKTIRRITKTLHATPSLLTVHKAGTNPLPLPHNSHLPNLHPKRPSTILYTTCSGVLASDTKLITSGVNPPTLPQDPKLPTSGVDRILTSGVSPPPGVLPPDPKLPTSGVDPPILTSDVDAPLSLSKAHASAAVRFVKFSFTNRG